jgi:DNA-binding MarR family transcriptional regulator
LSVKRKSELVADVTQALRALQSTADAHDEVVARRLGMNRTDHQCIDILDQAGGLLTAGELARATGLTTGAVTAVVDRLERAGFVRRARDDEDRRRVLVELTPKARQVGELYAPLIEATTREFGRYSVEELTAILDFVQRVRRLFADHTASVGRD